MGRAGNLVLLNPLIVRCLDGVWLESSSPGAEDDVSCENSDHINFGQKDRLGIFKGRR